ncbi:hypothetical protein S2M10_29240 [Sphingomonas sp. S2M10]|uniref:SGNH/GDSL hydrolase family protein n=1 Tax=Sphingomonas sp. S2M10 TaxID=2705010 RepID=UPI00145753E5|nr:SGNH/GDSL hydrolase family protein [Sphingomonas sp. S2M10]NLS27922.1 hypothetical protein [Sphingomonas sp. S2M10]
MDGALTLSGAGGGGQGVRVRNVTVPAGATGRQVNLQRQFGSASTFSLLSGTNANLQLDNGDGLALVAGLAAGATQTAIVQETVGSAATLRQMAYALNCTGAAPTPSPTPTFTLSALQAKKDANQRQIAVYLGDSLTAGWGSGALVGTASGTGAGSGGNFLRANAYPQQVADKLNARGILARADAFCSSMINNVVADLSASNPNITMGTGWTLKNLSFGGFMVWFTGSTFGSFGYTPQYPADKFDIVYATFGSLASAMTVSDANGPLSPSPVDCRAVTGSNVTLNGNSGMRRTTFTRSGGPSLDPISIASAGGDIYIALIVPHDTTSPRLEIINIGWPGSKAYDTAGNWSPNTTPSAANAWAAFYAIGAIDADAWFVELGANDKNLGVAAGDYQAALTNIINRIKAITPSANIVPVKTNTGVSGSNYTLTSDFLTAIDTVAASLSLSPVLDYTTLSLVTADRYDTIHLARPGYGKKADKNVTYLVGS